MADGPASHHNVVNTVTLTLEQVIDAVQTEIPEAKYVYDEQLSFESAAQKYRDDNNLGVDNDDFYPMFAFRRSPLRHIEEGASRRAATCRARGAVSNGSANVHRMMWGAFDLEFMYIVRDIETLERFEVSYLSEAGINGTKEVIVDLRSLTGEEMPFHLEWSILEDKEIVDLPTYYKAVRGTVIVKGFYFVLTGQKNVIMEINTKIQTFLKVTLASNQIVPPPP